MKFLICLGAGLALLAAGAVTAAELCDAQPCSVSLDFSSGGSISTSQGATLTFGSGGALVLGDGGTLTLSGSDAPSSTAPDMSGGGTLVLGAGGSIQFGNGGSLTTGDAGGIAMPEGSSFDVSGARSASVDSDAAVHLGTLHTEGSVSITSGGSMSDGDATSPFNFSTGPGDAQLSVQSGGDVRWNRIEGPPSSITLQANGSIVFTDDGSYTAGAPAGSASGCGDPGSSGSVYTYSGSPDSSSNSFTCSPGPGTVDWGAGSVTMLTPPQAGGGAISLEFLLLGLLARLRRR